MPGVLQSMWSQRVGHDWVTQQQKISAKFQWLPYAWEFSETQSTFKVVMLCLQLSRGNIDNWSLNQSMFQKQKETNRVMRNMKDQETLSSSFSLMLIHALVITYTENGTEKERRGKYSCVFSFFLNLISKSFLSNSLLSHRSKVLTECAHIKKWSENSWVRFCRGALALVSRTMCGGYVGVLSGKESACWCRRRKRCGLHPWVGKIPWRRKWRPTQCSCLENSWTEEPGGL